MHLIIIIINYYLRLALLNKYLEKYENNSDSNNIKISLHKLYDPHF